LGFVRHQVAAVVAGIEIPANLQLFKVVEALGGSGAHFRSAEGGKEHGGEYGNDGNYDQQLDQGEGLTKQRPALGHLLHFNSEAGFVDHRLNLRRGAVECSIRTELTDYHEELD